MLVGLQVPGGGERARVSDNALRLDEVASGGAPDPRHEGFSEGVSGDPRRVEAAGLRDADQDAVRLRAVERAVSAALVVKRWRSGGGLRPKVVRKSRMAARAGSARGTRRPRTARQ